MARRYRTIIAALIALTASVSTEAPRKAPVRWTAVQAVLFSAVLAVLAGCATPPNPYGALSETGSLESDGRGLCGAVALDATHALTAAHCVEAGKPVYYHAPGQAEGVRASAVALADRADIACLKVATEAAEPVAVVDAVGMAFGSAVELRGNMSDVEAGSLRDEWVRKRLVAELRSQPGDSGSGVYTADGALVGLLSLGRVHDDAGLSGLGLAVDAAALCDGL